MNAPAYLMCPPDHFRVDRVRNPWMADHVGLADPVVARRQWDALVTALCEAGARVETISPEPGLPDMCFASNAGVAGDGFFHVAKYRHPDRRAEESFYAAWFRARGYTIEPPEAEFEGEGDALHWRCGARDVLFAAYGGRSERCAAMAVGRALGLETVAVRLTDERFTHLDAAFCPLPGGRLMWYPCAFDRESREAVESRIPPPMRHALSACDALSLAASAIPVGDAVILGAASEELAAWLAEGGFRPIRLDLTEFAKSGGGAKALVLGMGGWGDRNWELAIGDSGQSGVRSS